MSGIESPVIVTMSPVSSPTQANTTNTQICENLANQLMLVLPDLEEISSMQQIPSPAPESTSVNIELEQIKESETPSPMVVSLPLPSPSPQTEPEKEKESKTKLIEEEKAAVIVKDFKYCYDEFEKQIKSQNVVISMETIMRMLRIAMVIVEQSSETGKNKKDFVVRMIAKIVTDSPESTIINSEMKVEILNMLYSPLFDDTIKLVVDASKGTLDLNKVQEVAAQVAVGCFSRCLAFLSKKN
jgi:hypothetical protein